MKKIKSIFTLLLFTSVIMFMSSCSNNTPEVVTKDFLTLIQKGKIKEAKELCDGRTKTLLGMVEGIIEEKALANKDKKVNIKIISSEINGDKAIVKYVKEGSELEESMNLKKIDGKWKISIDKEDLNK